jgi:hypothetical protein
MESIIVFPITYIAQKEWKYRTLVSLILTIFAYFLMTYSKNTLSQETDKHYYSFRGRNTKKDKTFKEKRYPFEQNTMTVPFFKHLWNMMNKHQVERAKEHETFWKHIDKTISFWLSIGDENLKENPYLIRNNYEKDLLHSCWTNNANQKEIQNYLAMDEQYQWRNLPTIMESYKSIDHYEKINWEHVQQQIQLFYRKIGIQLFKGTNEQACDCYEPPRFHGNDYARFEDLEKQHFAKNNGFH